MEVHTVVVWKDELDGVFRPGPLPEAQFAAGETVQVVGSRSHGFGLITLTINHLHILIVQIAEVTAKPWKDLRSWDRLVEDEGFEAGGANSVRGFGTGEVGREDYFFGRQAVIALNQELRYHHPSGFGDVALYDAGNTFASVSEMSLRLRHALGAGLRWNSPVGLLRVDFGAPLFPRPGEPRYKTFFSFGQAF